MHTIYGMNTLIYVRKDITNVCKCDLLIHDVLCSPQVHLKFEINPYDPAILRQLILSGSELALGTQESRRPTLAWLEDSSSCSDIPKLEGDRYYWTHLLYAHLVNESLNGVVC